MFARFTTERHRHGRHRVWRGTGIMEITNLPTFLDYLDSIHKRTRRVVMCIPPADIEWSLGSGRLTFGEIVRHLAGIERWMYAENVHGRPSAYPGHAKALAEGFEATVAYYDRLHAEAHAIFTSLDSCLLYTSPSPRDS